LPASATVPLRAVATTATAADEEHDDHQQGDDGHDDPGHLHPTWQAGRRFAVVHHARVAVGVGVGGGGPVSHVRVLSLASVAPVGRLGGCSPARWGEGPGHRQPIASADLLEAVGDALLALVQVFLVGGLGAQGQHAGSARSVQRPQPS
jgi:hypothetical protein